MLSRGFNLGIDFTGGTLLEIQAPTRSISAALRERLTRSNIGEVQVQGFSDPHHAMVRLPPQTARATPICARAARRSPAVVPGVTFGRTEVVGPKVSGELFTNGLIALGLAMLLMMVYIWLRFDLQFGVGAVLSLFHDAILTLGMFSVLPHRVHADGHRRAADHHRLFDERYGRRVRPHAGEFPQVQGDAAGRGDRSFDQRNALAHDDDDRHGAARVARRFICFGGETLRASRFACSSASWSRTYSSIYIAAPALPTCSAIGRGAADESRKIAA